MGILVQEATLPMGITLSNVYISFTGETIYINPKMNDMYRVNTTYRIFKNPSKEGGTNITAPLSLNVQDISRDTIYGMLYEELKIIYPDSIDIYETPVDTVIETPVDTVIETPVDTVIETPVDTVI